MSSVSPIVSALLSALVLPRQEGGSATLPRTEADAQVLATAAEVERKMAELRELSFVRPVEKQIYSREQLGAMLARQLEDEDNVKEIEKEELFLRAVGFLDPGVSLKELYRAMLQSQIAGFYDPKDKILRCISSDVALLQRLVLVHEIYHALQDQHFDLEAYVKDVHERTDAARARQAVVEGDAQYFSTYFASHHPEMVAEAGDAAPGSLVGVALQQLLDQSAIPPYFVDQLSWPYLAGANFIGALRDAGGWKRVDRVFVEPPLSTEQILHPSKYLDGSDPPLAVSARVPPAATAQRYVEVARDTIGEAGIHNLVKHLLDDPVHAARASAGWGGDECVVLRDPQGELLLVWKTVWDREKDAEEFHVAWTRLTMKQFAAIAADGGGALVATVLDHDPKLPEFAAGEFDACGAAVPTLILRRGREVHVLRGRFLAGTDRGALVRALLARPL